MIFGIGLPFTGTWSLKYALNYLGYRTVHCPHDPRTLQQTQNADFAWDLLRIFTAAVDGLVTWHFAELACQYPDAQFILTVREKQDWTRCLESFLRQAPPSLDELNYRQYLYYALKLDRLSPAEVYESHLQKVLRFFPGEQSHRLLVMDMQTGDGWDKLCSFLAKEVPQAPFPFPLLDNDRQLMASPLGEDMHSYRELLEFVCQALSPRHILEWGPGESTALLAKLCPQAKILSLEHDRAWYEKTRKRLHGMANIELVHCPHLEKFGGSQGYLTYPLRQLLKNQENLRHYDLIFIDGRSRCDCLTLASLLLSPHGVAVLHDSDRPNYLDGLKMFPNWIQYWDLRSAVAGHNDLSFLNDFTSSLGLLASNGAKQVSVPFDTSPK